MLLHLPPMDGHGVGLREKNGPALVGHGAEAVRDAIAREITTLPEQLRRSLTWDQGAEMAQHARLRIDASVAIYFCDPHSPWQRGTNENTNGLLRQYFPKGTDFGAHGIDDLAAVAAALNGRPRKTLGWKTPAEALDAVLRSVPGWRCDDRLSLSNTRLWRSANGAARRVFASRWAQSATPTTTPWPRASSQPSKSSCSAAAGLHPKPKRGWPASATSRAGITRCGCIRA